MRAHISRVVAVVLCLTAGLAAYAGAQSSGQATEYQVKAAFLYNFGKFVEWPAEAFASPTAPLDLCMVGADPFGDTLEKTVRGKMVNGHPINIRRLGREGELHTCHILFLSASERKALPQVLERVRGGSVLVVGETQRFAELGATFNFIVDSSRVQFEINTEAVERSRLRVSSKLLSLARLVRGSGPR